MDTHQPACSLLDVIIPAAGKGTRFAPFTKAVPKELLPLLNTPAIHHIMREAHASGITRGHIITHPSKTAIQTYFSQNGETQGKNAESKELDYLCANINLTYIEQIEQKGLGHAILMARDAVAAPFFATILPDDLLIGNEYCMQTLVSVFKEHPCSIIAVQEIPAEHVSRYGIISIKKMLATNIFEINDVVEKPSQQEAPSCYGIIGRYILSSDIFPILENTKPGALGEIQLTDGIKQLIKNKYPVFACVVPQERFDLGNPAGWLMANIFLGLKDPVTGPIIKSYITNL